MWSAPLPRWYLDDGRHHLPWRRTRDPWAVLLSEVMLQQTSVGRVLQRWGPLLERWPHPAALAAAPLDDLLRAWDGLGYPRRARSLHLTATILAAEGWPADEAGLRRLPGIGPYTARALLALSGNGAAATAPPRDVNLGRVAARAGLGVEPHQASPARLDEELVRSRPPGMSVRDHTLALFDLGATVCLARRPRCAACPVAAGCASQARLAGAPPDAPPRRQASWAGSHRQLRGAVLRALLAPEPPASEAELRGLVAHAAAAERPGAVEAALAELHREGLVPRLPDWAAPLACGPSGAPPPGGGAWPPPRTG
ncbi:MAG TPA: A/G-specific adenine glycosylase [Candidatus Dormibacteraeota bacterium]|nr:A/G-specific adenine glycosylase [Candidatus Dormibacteraeota bacterium]